MKVGDVFRAIDHMRDPSGIKNGARARRLFVTDIDRSVAHLDNGVKRVVDAART